jgi:hypothetical protein
VNTDRLELLVLELTDTLVDVVARLPPALAEPVLPRLVPALEVADAIRAERRAALLARVVPQGLISPSAVSTGAAEQLFRGLQANFTATPAPDPAAAARAIELVGYAETAVQSFAVEEEPDALVLVIENERGDVATRLPDGHSRGRSCTSSPGGSQS